MLQLLLVDDEPVILKSMASNDWGTIGVANVHTAGSGTEAVALLERQPIDIVVTDIRMPGMDGLALCQHISLHYPDIRCLLLSGYGEFEFARKAIQYGTVSYLLKPITDEELLGEVSRVGQGLREQWERSSSQDRARQTLRSHLPLLRSNLLGELLSGQPQTRDSLAARLEEYDIPFRQGSSCWLVMLRIDQGFGIAGEGSLQLFAYAVLNIASELLGQQYRIWHGQDDSGYLCLLLQDKGLAEVENTDHHRQLEAPAASLNHSSESEQERLYKAAQALQIKVTALLKGQLSIVLSSPFMFPDALSEHYLKLLNECRKIPRSRRELLMFAGDAQQMAKSWTSLYAPPNVQQLLEAGRWQEVKEKLQEIATEMREKQLDAEEHLMELYFTLLNAFLCIAHQQGKTLLELTGASSSEDRHGQRYRSPESVMAWAGRIVAAMEASGASEPMDQRKQLLGGIHRFVEANIERDVSLQTIADHVGLHPVYLSALYKQEASENLSDYIMRFRMEKAVTLLKSSDIKIYALAGRLGFQNPPYFTKLFKSYYGMTPQEYRERLVSHS
ncbi:response regulator [Paenibacillaceae bacterium]|nr:response regulator [Paenibacillaceae bacterium]